MIIKIDVTVAAPELAEAINHLAEGLPHFSSANEIAKEPAEVMESVDEKKPKKSAKGKKQSKSTNADASTPRESTAAEKSTEQEGKKVSLEEVRAKLAALSQDGKQAQVKELITAFGAEKLSDVPVEKYPELLEKAEVL